MSLALLWQAGDFHSSRSEGAVADPHAMRYERDLTIPAGSAGVACAVLDANVFAHAASRSGDDLRVFRTENEGLIETPFILGESEAQPDEVATAAASHVVLRDGVLSFDLAMPPRPYTTIELDLDAKDYVGIATVEGGAARTPMGQFAIFDKSAEGLGSSTALPLQESSYPVLHVSLRLWRPNRSVFREMSAAMVQGASVAPSREAQTIYTTVAETQQTVQEQGQTMAKLHVPAHVPVERVAFVLEKGFDKDFLRSVTIRATPDGTQNAAMVETASGAISTVHLPPYMDAEPTTAIFRRLAIDAALAAPLRSGATIEVAVEDAGNAALPVRLPITAVLLQMRERTVCFDAKTDGHYSLRYGDAGLRSPVYTAPARSEMVAPIVAALGPEILNSNFRARDEVRTYRERHPEMVWIGLVAMLAVLGSTALHGVKHQGRKG